MAESDNCAFGRRIESESLRTRAQLEKLWAKLDAEHDKIVKMESWQEYHAKSMEQVVTTIEVMNKKLDALHDDMTKGKVGLSIGAWLSERWIAIAAAVAAVGSWLHNFGDKGQ